MKTNGSVTEELASYIREKPVTEDDLKAAGRLALDAIANMIAGRNSESGKKLLDWANSLLDPASSRGLRGLDPARQAFLNAALCRVHELDDLHQASGVHPGSIITPALLALGQGLPTRDVLTALLHGYEACTRLGISVGIAHSRFWHKTGTCGPFGSAMAASHLLGLDLQKTVDALGSAGSQSAGLWEFLSTGSESKHLHAGRAAEAGLVAATLSALDFSGAPRILEGAKGLFRATCPDGNTGTIMSNPDAAWQVHSTSLKLWPCSWHTHPCIWSLLSIRRQMIDKGHDPKGYSRIEIETYQEAINTCDRVDTPTELAARHSLQHCAVATLALDEIDFSSFDEHQRTALAAKRQRVEVSAALDLTIKFPKQCGARVVVQHPLGGKFTAETNGSKGDPARPITDAELADKAAQLLDHAKYDGPFSLDPFLIDFASDKPFSLAIL